MGLLCRLFDVLQVNEFTFVELLQGCERSLVVSCQLCLFRCEASFKALNRSLVLLHHLLQLILELRNLVTCVCLQHADLLMEAFDLIL